MFGWRRQTEASKGYPRQLVIGEGMISYSRLKSTNKLSCCHSHLNPAKLACSIRTVARYSSQPFVWVTPAQSKCAETVHVSEGDAV